MGSENKITFQGDINGDGYSDRAVQLIGSSLNGGSGDAVIGTRVVFGSASGDIFIGNINPLVPYGWPTAWNRQGLFTRFELRTINELVDSADAAALLALKFGAQSGESFEVGDLVNLPSGITGRISEIAINLDNHGRVIGAAAYYISGKDRNEKGTPPISLAKLTRVESVKTARTKITMLTAKLQESLKTLLARQKAIKSEQDGMWGETGGTRDEKKTRKIKAKYLQEEKRKIENQMATIVARAVRKVEADGMGLMMMTKGVCSRIDGLEDLETLIEDKAGVRPETSPVVWNTNCCPPD